MACCLVSCPDVLVLSAAENGATAAAADGGLVLQEGEAAGNGDELSISEVRRREKEKSIPMNLQVSVRPDVS